MRSDTTYLTIDSGHICQDPKENVQTNCLENLCLYLTQQKLKKKKVTYSKLEGFITHEVRTFAVTEECVK